LHTVTHIAYEIARFRIFPQLDIAIVSVWRRKSISTILNVTSYSPSK